MTELDQLGTDGLCSYSRTQYANLHRNSLACFDLSCAEFHIYYTLDGYKLRLPQTERRNLCPIYELAILPSTPKITLSKLVVVNFDNRLRQLRLEPFQAERLFTFPLFQRADNESNHLLILRDKNMLER